MRRRHKAESSVRGRDYRVATRRLAYAGGARLRITQWGVGEALMRHAFRAFAGRGAEAVDLKVQASNAGAAALYERVGMRVVERL
jgi:GNAT superfamily N-acetyltransferase